MIESEYLQHAERVYDAWNRLVRVVRSSGPDTVLENEFNGLKNVQLTVEHFE